MHPASLFPLLRCVLLLVWGGAAFSGPGRAEQTLYYNFEAVNDPALDPVPNEAPGATGHGTAMNPSKLSINQGEEVVIDAVRYQLGRSLELMNESGETTTAGHISTGRNPTGWGMANGNSLDHDYTAMAWVKFKHSSGDNMIFGQLAGNNLHLGTRRSYLHSGHYGDDLGPDQAVSVAPGTGVWRHLAFVNEGRFQSIYLNGNLVAGPGADGVSAGDGSGLVIGTARTSSGSLMGTLDEIKIFDSVLSAAEIQQEMTGTLTPVALASLASARLDHNGYTFTLQDYSTNSVVDPATVMLEIDGESVVPDTVSKSGVITTITWAPPAPGYGSSTPHGYLVLAKDQTHPTLPNIAGGGVISMPVLPPDLPGPAGAVGSWGVREYRAGGAFGGNWSGASLGTVVDALAMLPAVDPDPATGNLVDGSAPVMNHSDPDQPGDRGNFNNDLPWIGHVRGGQEDNIAFVGKTLVSIPGPGDWTFSVHSDDGFALRVSGGPAGNTGRFTASSRDSDKAGIDPSDPRTIRYDGGTADSATTGVYHFSGAGIYEVLFVAFEATGGGFYEVAWAEGAWRHDRDTTEWSLVGSPADPAVAGVPFSPRFLTSLPGPVGGNGSFGIRTWLQTGNGVTSTAAASHWLEQNAPFRLPDGVTTFDTARNFLNLSDNRNADNALISQGHAGSDDALPGGAQDQNSVITLAKGRIRVGEDSPYTFNVRGDDGFLLRLQSLSGPAPRFSRASHPDPANTQARLEMSNPDEIYYAGASGDTLTRGMVFLKAGDYDLELLHWQATGGFWYELTAAAGNWPHGTEPPSGWSLVGLGSGVSLPEPTALPWLSAAGWTVESSAPGSLTEASVDGALAALAAGSTFSNHDAVNFRDPQNDGGPPPLVPAFPWPRNTGSDDNNFAVRSVAELIVPEAAAYRLGFEGDDGGSLTIRGVGGTLTPSWDGLLENLTGAGVIREEIAGSGVWNTIRTDLPTANSRTIGRILLSPGTYQLEALYFEASGGSWWRVIGAREPVGPAENTRYYPLAGEGTVPVFRMLPLVSMAPESIPLTDFAVDPATLDFSLSFVSEAGRVYLLEYSSRMLPGEAGVPETWNPSPAGSFTGDTGSTTVTGNFAAFHAAAGGVLPEGTGRVFLRVRRL